MDDSTYDERVKDMYQILKKKTSKGIALSKIKKYGSTRDGALAWMGLKSFYNMEGNKISYAATCLNKMIALRLEYHAPGGMDWYICQYELLMTQLQECEDPLQDSMAKTFFLRGIKDKDYDITKGICADSNKDFTECVALLKERSSELNQTPTDGQRPFRSRKAHQKMTTSPKKIAKSERKRFYSNQTRTNAEKASSKASGYNNRKTQGELPGSQLSSEVWGLIMSQDNKDLWIQMKNEFRGKGKEFGKQYESPRKANSKITGDPDTGEPKPEMSETDERKPAAKPESIKNALEKGIIWKPSVTRKLNMHKRKRIQTFEFRKTVT
jgi:hypothetical protein